MAEPTSELEKLREQNRLLLTTLAMQNLQRIANEDILKNEIGALQEEVQQLQQANIKERERTMEDRRCMTEMVRTELFEMEKKLKRARKGLSEQTEINKKFKESWAEKSMIFENMLMDGKALKTAEKKESLKCEICMRVYVEEGLTVPKVLGCGHTVCHGCCLQIATDKEIKCPFCRASTKSGFDGPNKLPKNFAIF